MSLKTALAHSNSNANNNPFAKIGIIEIFGSLVLSFDMTIHLFHENMKKDYLLGIFLNQRLRLCEIVTIVVVP
jgi:hypothetical protein